MLFRSSDTDVQREEIRQDIRARMIRGELPAEPELEEQRSLPAKRRPESEPSKANTAGTREAKHVPKVSEDDFFGEDDDAMDES